MSSCNIPYEITGIIITKMNRNVKHLLKDKILFRFVIRYSQIHPETLLIWLVKDQIHQSLVVYTSIKSIEVSNISDNVLLLLFRITIKNNNTRIFMHLMNVFSQRFNNTICIRDAIINYVIKVYLSSKYIKWLMILKFLINSCNDYVINDNLFIYLLEKDKSKKLVELLHNNQCINLCTSEIKVRHYIIIYNHLDLLKSLVINGYQITTYDIILSILLSNLKMVKYITSYFKPRLYTKGFRKMLLSIAAKRQNTQIYSSVYRKLR